MQSNGYSFLAQAIAKRLEELPLSIQEVEVPLCNVKNDVGNEELLRQIMVVYYPKLQRGEVSAFNDCADRLLCMFNKALEHEDLRFFDAFNCIYETANGKIHPNDDAWKQFLSCYKTLLNMMFVKIKRISLANAEN